MCGIVDEPPRPAPAGLKRLCNVGLHHQRDVAGDLAARAGEYRQNRCNLGNPVAMCMPGCFRQRERQFLSRAVRRCSFPCRQGLQAFRRRRQIAERLIRSVDVSAAIASGAGQRHILRVSRPNGIGKACCSHVRATIAVWRCVTASAANALIARSTSFNSAVVAALSCNIVAVSMTSWLVAPPVDVARRLRIGFRNLGRKSLDQRNSRDYRLCWRHWPARPRQDCSALHPSDMIFAAELGIVPVAASARASAASKSSMYCR